jgi:hypothetical protein
VGSTVNSDGLATPAAAEGQPVRAVRLFGAADHLRTVIATPVDTIGRGTHERVIADLRALLGEAPFATTWAEGRAMPLEAAIASALKKEAPADLGSALIHRPESPPGDSGPAC